MLKIFILFLTFQKRAHKLSLLAFLKVGCSTKFSIFLKTQNLARVERRRLLTVSCRLFYRTKWAKTVRHAELGVAKYDTRIIISAEKEETASLVPDLLKAFADLTYRQNTEVCIT